MTAAGFADPVIEAQANFRALLDVLARPGILRPLTARLDVPAPLSPSLAALALTLLDFETSVWLDAPLAASEEARRFLAFHTGVRFIANPADAAFALVSDPTQVDLSGFGLGTDVYPDRSTTVILAVRELTTTGGWHLTGPGINGEARLSVDPLPNGFLKHRADNLASFPRGIDLVFAAPSIVAALPRTTRVEVD